MKKIIKEEKGSLALEQVLFIGAVIVMSAGIFAFYGELSQYFTNVNISGLATVPTTGTSPVTSVP